MLRGCLAGCRGDAHGSHGSVHVTAGTLDDSLASQAYGLTAVPRHASGQLAGVSCLHDSHSLQQGMSIDSPHIHAWLQ